MELNSVFSKFFCYITLLDATLNDLQTRPLCQILLFLKRKIHYPFKWIQITE